MATTDLPLVSVVMSVHDGAFWLPECLRDLRAQTLQQIEIVVVDDGSTDVTPALLAEAAAQDSRIRVLTQANQGLTRALAVGCSIARGAYIARQDVDDRCPPERLARQLAALEAAPDAVLASCWVEDVTVGGAVVARHRDIDVELRSESGEALQTNGIPAHGCVLMRREAFERVGGYRSQFYYAQDSDLWLRMAEAGPFVVVPEVLYRRTVSSESISGRHHSAQHNFAELAKRCFWARRAGVPEVQLLEAAEELTVACRRARLVPPSRRERASSLLLIGAQVEARHPALARDYFLQALRCWPLSLRAWKRLLLGLRRTRRAAAAG